MADYRLRYKTEAAATEYASWFEPGLKPTRLKARALSLFESRVLRQSLDQIGKMNTVLELPIGTGRITPMLRTYACRVIGGDVSLAMLDVARKGRIGHESIPGQQGSLEFVLTDAEKIPLLDKSVDAVVCHGLFHQLPNSKRIPMLKEMGRVASKAVIASFAITGGLLTVRAQLRSLILGRNSGPFQKIPFPLTLDELNELLAEADLHVVTRLWTARYLSCQVVVLAEPVTHVVRIR